MVDTKRSSADQMQDPLRLIPDGDFELVPLKKDPGRGVNIDTDLPDLARKQLKACLCKNADLFAWSAAEMPELHPEVT